MEQLTPKQLLQLQTDLLTMKAKLIQQLDDGASATDVVVLDQTSVGRVSRMDALQQQSMAKSTRVNAQASLRKVAAALQRIDDSDYGYCCVCDEPIQFERLQVQPEASHCLNCQDRLDQA